MVIQKVLIKMVSRRNFSQRWWSYRGADFTHPFRMASPVSHRREQAPNVCRACQSWRKTLKTLGKKGRKAPSDPNDPVTKCKTCPTTCICWCKRCFVMPWIQTFKKWIFDAGERGVLSTKTMSDWAFQKYGSVDSSVSYHWPNTGLIFKKKLKSSDSTLWYTKIWKTQNF